MCSDNWNTFTNVGNVGWSNIMHLFLCSLSKIPYEN
jgi:hypothetical protein